MRLQARSLSFHHAQYQDCCLRARPICYFWPRSCLESGLCYRKTPVTTDISNRDLWTDHTRLLTRQEAPEVCLAECDDDTCGGGVCTGRKARRDLIHGLNRTSNQIHDPVLIRRELRTVRSSRQASTYVPEKSGQVQVCLVWRPVLQVALTLREGSLRTMSQSSGRQVSIWSD